MCTVVILHRPGHDWPLVLAANRDEMRARPWKPPARHWPDRGHVTAGLDVEAGGTWLALGDDGVVAGVLNRKHSLGPQAGKRSRGELPLEAVDHADARTAAQALAHLEPASYRSFNLVVADADEAYWLKSSGEEKSRVEAHRIPGGISMLTAYDMNDTTSPRMKRHLPRFRSAPPPDPEKDDWFAWQALLTVRTETGGDEGAAMNVDIGDGFGTVSSSLIALPRRGRLGVRPKWLFAAGRPDEAAYEEVGL